MVVLPTKAISGEITDQFTTTVDVEVIVESKLQHLAVQKNLILPFRYRRAKVKTVHARKVKALSTEFVPALQ